MLVLTRSPNEKVVVGECGLLKIQILEVDREQVRLRFIAPDDLAIDREEIFDLKQAGRKQTAKENDDEICCGNS